MKSATGSFPSRKSLVSFKTPLPGFTSQKKVPQNQARRNQLGCLPGLNQGLVLEMVALPGPQWHGNDVATQDQATGLPTSWALPFRGPKFQKLPQSFPQSPREERQHTM